MMQVERPNPAVARRDGGAVGARARQWVETRDGRSTRSPGDPRRRILIIDNYDSFVYNIVQWLPLPRAQIEVVRNDAIGVDSVVGNAAIAGVILSPGPMGPAEAGISNDLIAALAPTGTPMLGICLGHQCIGHVYGATVARHATPTHGKATLVRLACDPLFDGLPRELAAGRYHSLHVVDENLADCGLQVTARNVDDGTVMGLRHARWPVFGVQFHPESVLTGAPGRRILANFVALAGRQSNFARLEPACAGE